MTRDKEIELLKTAWNEGCTVYIDSSYNITTIEPSEVLRSFNTTCTAQQYQFVNSIIYIRDGMKEGTL